MIIILKEVDWFLEFSVRRFAEMQMLNLYRLTFDQNSFLYLVRKVHGFW